MWPSRARGHSCWACTPAASEVGEPLLESAVLKALESLDDDCNDTVILMMMRLMVMMMRMQLVTMGIQVEMVVIAQD